MLDYFFMYHFFILFNTDLLSAYYVSGALLKSNNTPVNKTDKNAYFIAAYIQGSSNHLCEPALQSSLDCLRDG